MSTTAYGWGRMFAHVGPSSRHSVYVLALAGLLLSLRLSACLPLDQFYPFNITEDEHTEVKDDGGSFIHLNLNFTFYDHEYSHLYVNNNGIISFLDKLKTYKPMNFSSKAYDEKLALIAPFWADIDIENVVDGGFNETVVYRQTNDSDVLAHATADVREYFAGQQNFSAELVFIVTWYNVGFYGAAGVGKTKRNTFQSVMITDGHQSYVIFNYNKTVWTTGSNSGGHTTTGLDGEPAVVGFHSGNNTYYMMEHSGTNDIVNINKRSNLPIPVPGKYIFRVDGSTVDDLSCAVGEKLYIHPASISMLGSEAVMVSGPCLNQDFDVQARILEANVTFPCQVVVSGSAICVPPPLFRTGELTFELIINQKVWRPSATINSVNLLSLPVKLVRRNPDQWLLDRMVTVTWGDTVAPVHISKTLEVLAYETPKVTFKVMMEKVVESQQMSTKIKLLADFDPYSTLVTRLCWQTHQAISPVCIWSDVFPVRWKTQNSDKSAKWCDNWIGQEKTRSHILVKPPFCPCVQTIADSDVGHFHKDPNCDSGNTNSSLNCVYNPRAYQCYRRNLKSPQDNGETCCYKQDGELMDIREFAGAGTHQRYHYKAQDRDAIVPFFSYFEGDLLPRLHCCIYSNKNCSGFKELRNATTCTGYTPPSPAQAAGDPHIVTLDGKNYTFNGLGDFYLVKHVDSSLAIQVRAVQATDDNGVPQNASIFSDIAIVMPGVSDVMEVRKIRDGAEILVNGAVVEASTSQYRNISITVNDNGDYLINLEPVSVSITVQVTPDLLNFIVLIGEESFKGNIRGLLGNYNKDPRDDFIARDGTQLTMDASMRDIHYDFGLTWAVPQSESYLSPNVTPVLTLEAEDFHPVFIGDIKDENLRAGAREICGDNIECLFDYQVTGKESIAKATMKFTVEFDKVKRKLDQVVVRCPFLEIPPNGNKTGTDYSVGSVASFTCDVGYDMVQGTQERVCQEDGSWSGSDVACAKKQTPSKTSSNILIYVGAAGGALVAILIILAVTVRIYTLRKPKHPTVSSGDMELQHIPVFENPIFMTSLQSLVRDGRFRIPRPQYVDPSIYQEYF